VKLPGASPKHSRAESSNPQRVIVAILGALLAVSACAPGKNGERVTEPSRAPSAEAMAAILRATVAIKTPKTAVGQSYIESGSGLIVTGSNGKKVVLTAAHIATANCKEQVIVVPGFQGKPPQVFHAAAGSPVESGKIQRPAGGGDQAVILPSVGKDVQFAPGAEIKASATGVRVGDTVYTVGFGGHYGPEGDSFGDPRSKNQPTLIPGVVFKVDAAAGQAYVLTGFDTTYNGPADEHAESGDSGGPAVVEQDGEFVYFGISSAVHYPALTPEYIAGRFDTGVEFDLGDDPDKRYGATVVDLVGGPQEIDAMVAAAEAC
jgi:hypothetical protein